MTTATDHITALPMTTLRSKIAALLGRIKAQTTNALTLPHVLPGRWYL